MFDWVIEGVRYIGWIIYAGMCYFISSIYETLLAIPNVLSQVLGNDTVNSLFDSMRALFFIFAGLMLVVTVLTRLFDWNVSKMMGQVKKIFLLSLILIGMPWFINTAENITNALISSGTNVMTSELGETENSDFGVSLANVYIYKNERYKDTEDYDEVDDAPFSSIGDVNDGDILNTTIENEDGDEVYVYTYMNPILGMILNLVIILLLMFANLKVYGYLYQLVILKVWTPLKAIKDGFDETPISELFGDFVTAFLSLAIQIVIVPFSLIMINVLVSIDGINLFEQLCAIIVGLYYMVFGIEYIQNKFMVESGVPGVFEVYAYSQAGKNLAEGLGNGVSEASKGIGNLFDKIRSSGEGDSLVDTGRETDLNAFEGDSDEGAVNKFDDNETDVNEEVDVNDTEDITEDLSDIDEVDVNDTDEVDVNETDDVTEDLDDIDEVDVNDTDDVTEDVELSEDIDIEDKDTLTEDVELSEDIDVDSNDNPSELDNQAEGVEPEPKSSNDHEPVEPSYSPSNENNIDNIDNNDVKSKNDNEVAEAIRPTEKQVKLAESMGIDVSGKDKYRLGNEIEEGLKEKNKASKKTSSKYVEPEYVEPEDVKQYDNGNSKLEEIIKGGW